MIIPKVYLDDKEYHAGTMMAFLRTLPNMLWWITLFLAVVAFFTQIGIAVARSGAVSVGMLLAEGSREHTAASARLGRA